jgi:3-oxoacyl-[acyl-carrier protein] reductase
MELGLRERTCVVTGAAGTIGAETALALAAEGASLLLVGRRAEPLQRLAEQCGAGASVVVLDITYPEAADVVLEACRARYGRIDVLVNSAGTTTARPLEQIPEVEWQQQWELHVMAPMRLMRALAPEMAERGWGRIVNVCSSAGKRPSASLSMPYSVTKAAQLSLSRAFADLYAPRGVLVNAIAPGPISGGLWEAPGGLADQLAKLHGTTRDQVLESGAARVPLGRYGEPREIAAVITLLCSERASFVAGAAWSIDGGAVPVII